MADELYRDTDGAPVAIQAFYGHYAGRDGFAEGMAVGEALRAKRKQEREMAQSKAFYEAILGGEDPVAASRANPYMNPNAIAQLVGLKMQEETRVKTEQRELQRQLDEEGRAASAAMAKEERARVLAEEKEKNTALIAGVLKHMAEPKEGTVAPSMAGEPTAAEAPEAQNALQQIVAGHPDTPSTPARDVNSITLQEMLGIDPTIEGTSFVGGQKLASEQQKAELEHGKLSIANDIALGKVTDPAATEEMVAQLSQFSSWADRAKAFPLLKNTIKGYDPKDQRLVSLLRPPSMGEQNAGNPELQGEITKEREVARLGVAASDLGREQARFKAGLVGKGVSGTATDSAEIEVGSNADYVARMMSTGALTFPQFRTLVAYNRNAELKMAVFKKASEYNPNFNPAEFEAGYKLFARPQTRQQIAAMDNVLDLMPSMERLSDEAVRSDLKFLNKVIIPGGMNIGGKKYSNLHVAAVAMADELSGALGFGTTTDMTRQMGFDMTDPTLSPEQFTASMRDVVIPFILTKRATLVNQMGIYEPPRMPGVDYGPEGKPKPPTNAPPTLGIGLDASPEEIVRKLRERRAK